MARTDELSLGSRYIHTGNSGVTLNISRDVKRVDRAILSIRNGAFGAFSTTMEVRGNDTEGMSSRQLRDLALMFLDAAADLEEGNLPLPSENPSLVPRHLSLFKKRGLPPSISDLLPYYDTSLNIRGERFVPGLLKKYPDISLFYKTYVENVSTKPNDDDEMVGEEEEGLSMKSAAEKRRRAKERMDNFLLSAGIEFIRTWWLAHQAEAALTAAVSTYEKVCEKVLAGVPEQISDEESPFNPTTVKGSGILSK